MDVVVIGAGYAGLSAAYSLFKKGLDVIVLEAQGRVGGRTLECTIANGERLELGGQYISSLQTRVNNLVKELGLQTFGAWSSGDSFLSLGGKVARYDTTPIDCLVKKFGFSGVDGEIKTALLALENMFQAVSTTTPWLSPGAKELDSMTFATWIANNLKDQVSRDFFRFITNQGFSTEPSEVSVLQMLYFFKASHGLPAWASGGSQASRVLGGTQLVLEKLVEKLGVSKVNLNQQVLEIKQDNNGVQVYTQNNKYIAKAVIVSVPVQLVNKMQYDPILPVDMFRAFGAMQTGNAMKVQAIYDRPFWRDQNLSGNGIMFEGPQTFTYDNTLLSGEPGILLGFLTADRATVWNRKSLSERRNSILKAWANVFGPKALSPIDYIEYDWAGQEFIRGGHGCHFTPGVWCELGSALGSEFMPRFGKIIWASSDLAKDWNGYLEGAIYAGEQAALEIVKFCL